jgi:hypothetical protein
MAHYAFLNNNNLVTEVIVGRDEDDLAEGVTSWEDYYGAVRGQRCLQTSYNTQAGEHLTGGTPFRGNYAGIGFTYDEALDAFIAPSPFASWVLNEATFSWEAPIPYPSDGKDYIWDEDAGVWVEVEDEAV